MSNLTKITTLQWKTMPPATHGQEARELAEVKSKAQPANGHGLPAMALFIQGRKHTIPTWLVGVRRGNILCMTLFHIVPTEFLLCMNVVEKGSDLYQPHATSLYFGPLDETKMSHLLGVGENETSMGLSLSK